MPVWRNFHQFRGGFTILACYLEGRYLTKHEVDFLNRVATDITDYLEKSDADSALVFPPLTSYHRFLVHQIVQEHYPSLVSFSVGKNDQRRTVIFWREDGNSVIQNDDFKKKTASSFMETANPRSRSRRPDMQLYVPRAMRRDSHDTTSSSSDKTACFDSSNDALVSQRNCDAIDNKKSRSKKSAVCTELLDNNCEDTPQRKRVPRAASKNSWGQNATDQSHGSAVDETSVPQGKKDDKMKKCVKKTKRNVKPYLIADTPSNGEVGFSHLGDGDHECVPDENKERICALNVTDAGSADLICSTTKPNSGCETSPRQAVDHLLLEEDKGSYTKTYLDHSTGPVLVHITDKLESESIDELENLPESKSSSDNTCLEEKIIECAEPELRQNLPVPLTEDEILNAPSLEDKPAVPEVSDQCSTVVKSFSVGTDCNALFVPSSIDCDMHAAQVDEKLTDQVRLLSSCNVSELTKLGCENIELFLKESAGLIAELENNNLGREYRVVPSTETNAANVEYCAEQVVKDKDVCSPQEIASLDINNLSLTKDTESSLADSCISEKILTTGVSLPTEEEIASSGQNITKSASCKLTDTPSSGIERSDSKSLPCCSVSLPQDYDRSSGGQNECIMCTSSEPQTSDGFNTNDTSTCISSVLPLTSNSMLTETNNNVNIPDDKPSLPKEQRSDGDSFIECRTLPSEEISHLDMGISDTSLDESTDTAGVIGSSDASFVDTDVSLENGQDSWEAMYDEAGECLNPELMKELTITVGKKIKVQKAKIDYTKFQPKEPQISDNEFGHVIEIYDFPVEFKTQDLMAGFAQFQNRGFDIKWVDDTHALGLFSSPMAAADALTAFNPMFKTRPLSQATRESKVKAKRCAEFLQPYRPRPETSASLARRLVSGALGLQVRIPKEQRELERQKLREAKEKRKLAAKQKVNAWEGVIASPP